MKYFFSFLFCFVLNSLFAQTKNFIDLPFIETMAEVDTLIVPNEIHLNITLSENDTKDKKSVEELENAMEKKFISLGIDTKKNLTLNDLASNYKKHILKQKDVIKTKSFNLITSSAKMAGTVIAELEDLGISNVSVAKIHHTEYEKIKMLLKEKAVKKAKNQSVLMLKPLNQKVGNAIFVSDISNNSNYSVQNDGYLQGRVSGVEFSKMTNLSPIDVEFKKIKIKSEVHIKFKIE